MKIHAIELFTLCTLQDQVAGGQVTPPVTNLLLVLQAIFMRVRHTVLGQWMFRPIEKSFRFVVVVVEILFRIADLTGRFAQYYDGDIIREVNSKEMTCLVHVVYHQ